MSQKIENFAQDGTFSLYDEDRTLHQCEILFSFNYNEQEVIAYTDGSEDEDGNLRVFASVIGESNGDGDTLLLPIEDEDIWEAVDSILEEISNEE